MHKVELIAIGNGTASRETDKLAAELIASLKDSQPQLTKVMVSEAGASVYSASELAALEFPELDVSIRGAVSIARRLQDPLAELVKIEPKSIGVGQYQHDVSQSQLSSSLEAVVEDCVNGVGVDLNMASVPLLSQVAGLNKTLAKNVVDYRDANGAFKNRKELLKVPRLGPKAFEQAAGFYVFVTAIIHWICQRFTPKPIRWLKRLPRPNKSMWRALSAIQNYYATSNRRSLRLLSLVCRQ